MYFVGGEKEEGKSLKTGKLEQQIEEDGWIADVLSLKKICASSDIFRGWIKDFGDFINCVENINNFFLHKMKVWHVNYPQKL